MSTRERRSARAEEEDSDEHEAAPTELTPRDVMKWLASRRLFGAAYSLEAEIKSLRADVTTGHVPRTAEPEDDEDALGATIPSYAQRVRQAAAFLYDDDASARAAKQAGRNTRGAEERLRASAVELGAAIGAGHELDGVLTAMARGISPAALPVRAYARGISDLLGLVRSAPPHCAAQVLELAFSLLLGSFFTLALPPVAATKDAARLVGLVGPAFDASHPAELAELAELLGASPGRLLAWGGSPRSLDGARPGAGPMPQGGGTGEVPGLRAGHGEVRVLTGPDFGPQASRPHPLVEWWSCCARGERRQRVVRMSALSRGLALGLLQRRAHVAMLALMAEARGCVRVVLSGGRSWDSGAGGAGGGWTTRAGAGGEGDGDDEGRSSSSSSVRPPVPLPPRTYGTGQPLPPGSAALAGSCPRPSWGFFYPAETPAAVRVAADVAEATAVSRADDAEGRDAAEEARAAVKAAAELGAADDSTGTTGDVAQSSKQCASAAAKGPQRGLGDASAVTLLNAAHMLVAAGRGEDPLEGLAPGARDGEVSRIVEALQRDPMGDDVPDSLRGTALPAGKAEAEAVVLAAIAKKRPGPAAGTLWPQARVHAGKTFLALAKQVALPGGSVAAARALAAMAGVGRRGPRPAGMLDASLPAPSQPSVVGFTVLQGEGATCVAVGARRGTVVAGFGDGHVAVWSNARSRWAERHEAEPHRAARSGAAGEGRRRGGAAGSSGLGAGGLGGQGEEDEEEEDVVAEEEEDDDDVLGGSDDDAGGLGRVDADAKEDDDDDLSGAQAMVRRGAAGRSAKRSRPEDGPALATFAAESTADDSLQALPRHGRRRPAVLVGHCGPVHCASLSPGEDWLLTGGADGCIRLWSVPAARCVAVYRHAAGPVWSVDWAPALPSLFASAHADGAARVWHTARPSRPVRVLHTYSRSADVVAFHPGAHMLLVGAADGSVRVESVEDATTARLLIGHRAPVTAACWSPCGRLAFTADTAGAVRCWDVVAGRSEGAVWVPAPSARGCAAVAAMAVSPSSRALVVASTDSTITTWDVTAWRNRAARLRRTHTVDVPRTAPPSSARGRAAAATDAVSAAHTMPAHIVSAEAEAEEAALAEQAAAASSAAAGVAPSRGDDPSGLRVGGPVYGKSSRFGALAFSRDGVLAAAAVFAPPLA